MNERVVDASANRAGIRLGIGIAGAGFGLDGGGGAVGIGRRVEGCQRLREGRKVLLSRSLRHQVRPWGNLGERVMVSPRKEPHFKLN
jgi:hypothetical protein